MPDRYDGSLTLWIGSRKEVATAKSMRNVRDTSVLQPTGKVKVSQGKVGRYWKKMVSQHTTS